MSILGLVGVLVWEIVSNTVVKNAETWLSEFVLKRILPLWQRYWPVIYQSVLVPAYHLVSDTIPTLLHDLLSNLGDSSAVSASESPPGGTSAVTAAILPDPAETEAEMNDPQLQQFILGAATYAAAQAGSSTSDTRASAGGTSAVTETEADMNDPQLQQFILATYAAAQAGSSTSDTRASAGGTSAVTETEADMNDPQLQQFILGTIQGQ